MPDERGTPSDGRRTEVNRRSFLRQSSLLGGVFASGVVGSGLASADAPTITYREDFSVERGSPGPTSKWNAMHVDAIVPAGAEYGDSFLRGMHKGFDQIYDALDDWLAGVKLRAYEIHEAGSCSNRLNSLATILNDVEETPPQMVDDGLEDPNRLYHFALQCADTPDGSGQSPRRGGRPWGDRRDDGGRPISTVSIVNNLNGRWFDDADDNNAYQVRAVHEALHMFIDGQIAGSVTGIEDDPYKAQHTLGTVVEMDGDHRRTVMADLATGWPISYVKDGYEDEAKGPADDHPCGSSYDGNTKWPLIDDLRLSECTRKALRASALQATRDQIPDFESTIDFHETVWVDVTVEDATGAAITGQDVELVVGPLYDPDRTRSGTSGERGRVVFRQNVGDVDCLELKVRIPNTYFSADLGCVSGGEIVSAEIQNPYVHQGSPEKSIEVRSADGSEVRYALDVDRRLDFDYAADPDVSGNEIDGDTAVGTVEGDEVDVYRYEGDLRHFQSTGATVDGSDEPDDPPDTTTTITVEGPPGRPRLYGFAVDRNLTKSTAHGANKNGNDNIDGNVVRGAVHGGRDSYTFDGDLRWFQGAEVTVYLDGDEVDPSEHAEHRVVSFEGNSDDSYELDVEENLGRVDALRSIDVGDDPEELGKEQTSVSESFEGTDKRSFRFDGAIEDLSVSGTTVWLDNEQVEPADYGSTHTITLESSDDINRRYSFAVEDDLAKSRVNGATENVNDDLTLDDDGVDRVDGVIFSGRDSYTFTGEVVWFQGEEVTVYLDGDEVDVADHVERHAITIDGSGFLSTTGYSFETGGDAEKSGAIDATENVTDDIDDAGSGSEVAGQVRDRRDSYVFDGELSNLEAGDATVYLDNEIVQD